MGKFFIPPESIKNNIALVSGAEARHILNVMRLKKEDEILAFDGTGRVYQGRILDTADKKVCIQIERILKEQQVSNLEITLAQALPKRNKMDYIVEKATELGVDTIIPVVTSRTIVKLDEAGLTSRKMRWERVALAAAKQCGRRTIPQLKTLTPWPELLSCLDDFDLKLLFSLSEKAENLKDVLRLQKKSKKLLCLLAQKEILQRKKLERPAMLEV